MPKIKLGNKDIVILVVVVYAVAILEACGRMTPEIGVMILAPLVVYTLAVGLQSIFEDGEV